MKEELKQLLEIVKHGNADNFIEFLPKLKVRYFKDRDKLALCKISSCFEEIESFLKIHSGYEWNLEFRKNISELIKELILFEEKGLLILTNELSDLEDTYLPWSYLRVNSDYFIENNQVEAWATVDLDAYLEMIRRGDYYVIRSVFSDSIYISEIDMRVGDSLVYEDTLRISNVWNTISEFGHKNDGNINGYNQPIFRWLIGVSDGNSYNIAEVDETKIKEFIDKIQEYVIYD